MKDGLCNLGNSLVTIHKKMCYRFNAYYGIEDYFHNCGTCYILKGYDI